MKDPSSNVLGSRDRFARVPLEERRGEEVVQIVAPALLAAGGCGLS